MEVPLDPFEPHLAHKFTDVVEGIDAIMVPVIRKRRYSSNPHINCHTDPCAQLSCRYPRSWSANLLVKFRSILTSIAVGIGRHKFK